MTDTEKAQQAELKRLRSAIEATELKIMLAKLTHVRPLIIQKARIRLERDIAREEGRLTEQMADSLARQLDDIPGALRDAKRSEVEPLVEELREFQRRKRALRAEIASGQQRMAV